jgi:large subunit ribosomal protein L21
LSIVLTDKQAMRVSSRITKHRIFDISNRLPYTSRVDMEYAVIETGGKQYTVHPGDVLQVEKLDNAQEEVMELDRVLLISRDGAVKIGKPLLEGAKVKAEVVEHGKAPKVTVFKFKAKVRYKKKVGHRQQYTELKIVEIIDG